MLRVHRPFSPVSDEPEQNIHSFIHSCPNGLLSEIINILFKAPSEFVEQGLAFI